MAYTAQDPLTEAKILLNDPSGHVYADDKLLPLMQKAYRELQLKMQLNGLAVMKEKSSVITVTAGTVFLGDAAGLPSDFVLPIDLQERASGSSEDWTPMEETDWEPDIDQTATLRFWNFREEQVKFVGATANREVLMKYQKGLTRITAVTTPIQVIGAETFLASRTAAIAAIVLGENPSRAEAINGDAGGALHDLISLLVKQNQGFPIRRRVNRYRR
jgi:hypothetical protein